MSHSITPAEIQRDKQDLYDFVDESSKWRMKDKGNVTEYAVVFWYLCEPLITFRYMSLGECEELFLQGFHPDIRAKFPPEVKQQIRDILQSPPHFAAHSSEVPSVPSPSTSAPSPPVPEMLTPPTDLATSAPAAPAER